MTTKTAEKAKSKATAKRRTKTQQQAATHKLVSIENSHSWLKRHDGEGTLVIQAGWRTNPSRNAKRDDQNPIIVYPDNTRRWYGSIACMGPHESSLNLRKDETARHALGALLRPSDHGEQLIVLSSHWDADTSHRMATSLRGPFSVVRNGHEITVNVAQVIPLKEGLGSFWLAHHEGSLKPGLTLLIEFGYGTAESWLIDEQGDVLDGDAVDALAIFQLVQRIADDPSVRHALKAAVDNEQTINLSLISAALKAGTLGKLSLEQWEAIKHRYVTEWIKSVQGHLVKAHSQHTQVVSNIVFTGGGAELLRTWAESIAIIPKDAQTASVRGAYLHHQNLLDRGNG